eukprot:124397-Pleurochrysis_carterae.AAC.1
MPRAREREAVGCISLEPVFVVRTAGAPRSEHWRWHRHWLRPRRCTARAHQGETRPLTHV